MLQIPSCEVACGSQLINELPLVSGEQRPDCGEFGIEACRCL